MAVLHRFYCIVLKYASLDVNNRVKCTKNETCAILLRKLHMFHFLYISRERNSKKNYHVHLKQFIFVAPARHGRHIGIGSPSAAVESSSSALSHLVFDR